MNKYELLLNKVKLDEYVDALTDEYDFNLRFNIIKLAIKEIEENNSLDGLDVIYDPKEYSLDALDRFKDRLITQRTIYQELINFGYDDNEKVSKELYNFALLLINNKEYNNVYEILNNSKQMGNLDASILLGKILLYGKYNVKPSPGEALECFKYAALNDNMEACYEIALMFDYDNDYVPFYEAQKFCKKASDLGYAPATERLNHPFEYKSKFDRLEERINNYDKEAIYEMFMYLKNTEDSRMDKYLKLGLEQNEPNILVYVALEEFKNKNKDQAIKYLYKAIDNGSYIAYKYLGDFLTDTNFYQFENNVGNTALKSHLEQFDMYLEASKYNVEEVIMPIDLAYYYGYPVFKDYKKSMYYLLKACELDNILAMYYVGLIYKNGYLGDVDTRAMMMYFTAAANKGSKEAIDELCDIYRNGYLDIEPNRKMLDKYIGMIR